MSPNEQRLIDLLFYIKNTIKDHTDKHPRHIDFILDIHEKTDLAIDNVAIYIGNNIIEEYLNDFKKNQCC